MENHDTEYIHASVTVFDNGARLYQIQPHPEMAAVKKANFLVRKNTWLADEMGREYYEQALVVPENADFSIARVITSFIVEARNLAEEKRGKVFLDSVVASNLYDYLQP